MAEYDAEFFDTIREGCKRSAEIVVPKLAELLIVQGGPDPTRRIIDVGCGEGWWGKAFADLGDQYEVLGLDGPTAEPVIPLATADLADPLPSGLGTFDLALCLEVAEHLPPERADGLVADLCSLSKRVVFSAAIPGQGGTGHVNEQWPAYWVERFAAHGYGATGSFRFMFWNDDRVENWYRQNLLVFSAGNQAPHFGGWPANPLPLVHPVLYDARRT
jgi:SAM-dependent methyltransferase